MISNDDLPINVTSGGFDYSIIEKLCSAIFDPIGTTYKLSNLTQFNDLTHCKRDVCSLAIMYIDESKGNAKSYFQVEQTCYFETILNELGVNIDKNFIARRFQMNHKKFSQEMRKMKRRKSLRLPKINSIKQHQHALGYHVCSRPVVGIDNTAVG
ncbi:CLUMA_CG018301, isoform A [Clunio marinus]|uniref:CLUMA_CG018301, isoform A n=1 Tax=Clunio marinus TaxID=568069 RepID=A0A1J1IZ00_9DIPT|nr:CLUMA_CG018301, isoform A [Clunio marinus]